MTTDIKELVKRLRGGKCPQCFGFGEVSYGGELVRCSCRDKYEAPISMEYRKDAADAIEALVKERDAATKHAQLLNNMLGDAEAERDAEIERRQAVSLSLEAAEEEVEVMHAALEQALLLVEQGVSAAVMAALKEMEPKPKP